MSRPLRADSALHRLSAVGALLLLSMPGCGPEWQAGAARSAPAIEEQWPTWHDAARNRDVAARLFIPESATAEIPAPLVVFSHGVGESILSYEYLGRHWAANGFIVLFVEHAGSDVNAVDWDAVTVSLLRAARDPTNWTTRPRDVSFALDQVEADDALRARVDFSRVTVAGHSLGAQTALLLAGAVLDIGDEAEMEFRDPRIRACLALSPPAAGMLGLNDGSWVGITVPLLVAYGSLDTDIILKDANARRGVFDGAVHAERWLLVFNDVEHETFTGRDPAFPISSAATLQQGLIANITTAWLNAYARDDDDARERLRAGGFDGLCRGGCATEHADGM